MKRCIYYIKKYENGIHSINNKINLGGAKMKELTFALKPEDIKDKKQREIVLKCVKLREIVQKNFFSSGRFEISNVQLAEITGKDIKQVNRDIREEFTFIRSEGNDISGLRSEGGENGKVTDCGLELLKDGVREAEEPDERNRMRPVIYLSGLALAQILSRWSPLIRLLINTTIYLVKEKLIQENRVIEAYKSKNKFNTVI